MYAAVSSIGDKNVTKVIDVYDSIEKNKFKNKDEEGDVDNITEIEGSKEINIYFMTHWYNEKEMSEKKNCKNIGISLLDKTFYAINKTHSVILPSNLDSNKEIIIVNKIKYSVRKMNFETENKISFDVSLREYDGNEKIRRKKHRIKL